MTDHANATGPSIRLPATLAIGFTGHRKLPDESKSRKLVYDFLSDRKTAAPGLIYGVSSVAAGADLLFCESCLQLEIPLHVLLPMPAEEFRHDFDLETWARAAEVMRQAVSVEVTERYILREYPSLKVSWLLERAVAVAKQYREGVV